MITLKLDPSKWRKTEDELPTEGCFCVCLVEDIPLPLFCYFSGDSFYQSYIKIDKKTAQMELEKVEKVIAWNGKLGVKVPMSQEEYAKQVFRP